ncbi:BRCT domain-containing DNA repair protein [Rhynchospora pubera]|uniref:BRCT domain-containing DNA repair protein n=1 Tax=Rhynchospora pubera TaxID=906938 RepID=A0AAV8C5N3_9POAL|nr:BRCT domain-containing DNA repair protein [Rhynchospora pubera]
MTYKEVSMDVVSTHDGLETQLVDEDSTELGSPFTNCPMEEDNVDETSILFGKTQLVEDPCNYEGTQILDDLVDPGFTEVLEDPDGETQLVGDPVGPGFTQVLEHPVDMAIETQLVEDMGDWINTQLVGHEEKGEAEEEKTGCENGLCEAGSGDRSCGEKEEQQRVREECEEKECLVDSDASTDDEGCGSGIIQRRLTSLRVASVRSCALAASRKFSSKLDTDIGNDTSKSSKVFSKNSTLDYTLREKVDSKANNNGLNKSKKKMVRQLFADVTPETERFSPVPDLPPKDSVPVYVDESQEPGILSQENALEVIDKLIASHDVSPTCKEPRNVRSYESCGTAAILPQTSAQAGTIQLAKDIDTSSLAKKSGIFDWDDVREDETGGDFFVKKKAMFYGKRSQSQPPKGKEKKNTRDLGRSDSRLILQQRDKVSYSTVRKNLFNERENEEQPLERGNEGSFHALSNVGPDTQIAVEAIQALVHGSPGRPGSPEGTERIEIEKGCIPGDERKVRIASTEGVEKTTEKASKSGRKRLMPLVQIYVATKDQSVVPDKIRDGPHKTGLDISSNLTPIPRKARSLKRTDLLGKTETLKNLGQNATCRKRKVFIRSATELVDKAKRCRRVSLSDKEKIGTPSMEIGKGSPVFTPKKSQRKALDGGLYRPSVQKEMLRLETGQSSLVRKWKDLRVRRDLAEARVLLSNHLDERVTRQQQKILKRLGIPEAFSMSDGTHFVADKFFRTRNFLEAMARGKPIVTPSWLERCNLSNQFVDEKNFILRDAKKEKELCFSMPNSLATASHSSLLKGKRVLITSSIKPSLEVVRNLVIACGGTPMERIVSSLIKGKVRDDLLLISCEEDYETCRPLLEKGVDAYSSEVILNGIVIQKLEFGRHRLFSDCVKRTRSTIWIREVDGDKFIPTSNVHRSL